MSSLFSLTSATFIVFVGILYGKHLSQEILYTTTKNLILLSVATEIHSAPQNIVEQIQNGTNIIPGLSGGTDPIQIIQNQTNINVNPGDFYEQIRNQTGGVMPAAPPPNVGLPTGNPGDYYEQIRNQTGSIVPLPNVELPMPPNALPQNCIPGNILGQTTVAPTTTEPSTTTDREYQD